MDAHFLRKTAPIAALALLASCGRDGATASPGQPSATFPPIARPPYVYVDQFDVDNRLKVLSVTTVADAHVDTTGLQVDVECARQYRFKATLTAMRIELLEVGCAKVTAANPPAEETLAQNGAQQANLGMWATPEPPSTAAPSTSPNGDPLPPPSPQPGVIDRILGWLDRNWVTILGLVLGFLSLPWVAILVNRRQRRRNVDVVLTGLPGAGKTDLWTAWHDDNAPTSNAKPTVGTHRSSGLPTIPWGDHTLCPTVIDAAGADPAGMLNVIGQVPKRQKRVLIFVIAPSRSNVAGGASTIDDAFVLEQRGYASFPRALVGAANTRIKPNLVVLFLTKFDLLSKAQPGDTTNSEVLAGLTRKFDAIRRSLHSDCARQNIPFKFLVGTAKTGWGVRDLRDSVINVLNGRSR